MTSNEVTQASDFSPDKGPWLGVRHLIIFMLFLSVLAGYAMRVNLSIAIVDMVDGGCKDGSSCDKFPWDKQLQTVILSSFFWGYVVLQVPSALLAQKFGIKWLLFLGVAISSIGTLLTPIIAKKLDWGGVCAMRVLEGFSQGTLYPSIHAALAAWSPPAERGLLASFTFSGSQIGTIVTFAVSGFLARTSVGWPLIFYVFGGIGFVWCVVWPFVASNKPSEHSFISEKEKNYIERSVAITEMKATFETPWLELARSPPMWAILIAHCAQNWSFWILCTGIPTFMKDILKQDIKENGLLSSLPYLAMAVASYVFGWVQDYTLRKNVVTLATSRKIFNTISFWGPAAALTALSFVTEDDIDLAVVLLILAVGLNGGVYIGFQVNHIDLSPNFAGTMMGITNCISNVFSLMGPLIVGVIGSGNEDSREQWKLVFWITSAVYFVGNAIFIFFGTADRQPWDDPNYKRRSKRTTTGKAGEELPRVRRGYCPGLKWLCLSPDTCPHGRHVPGTGEYSVLDQNLKLRIAGRGTFDTRINRDQAYVIGVNKTSGARLTDLMRGGHKNNRAFGQSYTIYGSPGVAFGGLWCVECKCVFKCPNADSGP